MRNMDTDYDLTPHDYAVWRGTPGTAEVVASPEAARAARLALAWHAEHRTTHSFADIATMATMVLERDAAALGVTQTHATPPETGDWLSTTRAEVHHCRGCGHYRPHWWNVMSYIAERDHERLRNAVWQRAGWAGRHWCACGYSREQILAPENIADIGQRLGPWF